MNKDKTDGTKNPKQSLLHSHLNTVIDTAVDAIIIIAVDGAIQTFNKAAQKLFGYTEADVKDQNVRMLMPDPDRRQHDSYISNYITTEKPKIIGIGRLVTGQRKDGSTFPMELSVGDIKEEDERVGFVGIIRNVSERVEAEKRLLATHKEQAQLTSRLTTVIDTAVDAIIIIAVDGAIQTFNKAAQKLFGYTEADVKDQNVRMLMPDPDRRQHDSYISNYITTQEPKIIGIGRLVTGQRKDGSTFPMELSVGDIIEKGERVGFVGIIRNVTERVEAEKVLKDKIEDLARSNADLEQFAYVASHDLKAPLRGILNLSEWIEENIADTADEETTGYLRLLKNRITRLESLLAGLLEYSRVGQGISEVVSINLNSLINDIVEILDGETKSFTFEYSLPTVVGVQSEIMQIFQNLISNAINHNIHKPCKITIIHQVKQGKNIFQIQDNGIGIPVEMWEKVFEMFQTLKPRDQVEGSGMGLAIVKKLITRRGGDIWLEKPEEDTGLIVCFSLPVGEE